MPKNTDVEPIEGEVVTATIPEGAKKPQDRKPKKVKSGPGSIEAPTPAEVKAGKAEREVEFGSLEDDEDGDPIPLTYTVDLMAFDDIVVLEAFERSVSLSGVEQGVADMTANVTLVRALLGVEQYERFKREQKQARGRVNSAVLQDFITAAAPGN